MFKKGMLIMVLISAFGFIACSDPAKKSMLKNGEDFVTEGWLDDNTFQVRSLGAPNPASKGLVRRRTQSKEAALLAAQKRAVELIVGAKIQGASGSDSGESTGIAITKEFEGHVKGGAIVKETYDQDDNCEMTYRMHAQNLKKMASTEVTKTN